MMFTQRSGERGSAPRRNAGEAEDRVWIEAAARAGYAAKGAVYALIGILAIRAAAGSGGDTSDTQEVVELVASGPFGTVLVGLLAGGLVGYVTWRLAQALLDPEAGGDDGWKRRAMRTFYFGSAVMYGTVAFNAARLTLGGTTGGGSGSGRGLAGWMMSSTWGVLVVGAVGVGIAGRGGYQFVKAYTANFRDRIRSFDLTPGRSSWILHASRVGLTARGVIFMLLGGFVLHGAVTHDPSRAGGQEMVLESIRGQPWLLAPVGAGLFCYAVYQWVKARYRLVGVDD